jgi:hypothetical protein
MKLANVYQLNSKGQIAEIGENIRDTSSVIDVFGCCNSVERINEAY